MYIVDTGKFSDLPLNLLLVFFLVIAIAIFCVFYFTKRKPVFVNSSQLSTTITYTGVGMPCNDNIQCLNGYVCQNTSIGNVCLAPLGGICSNLQECVGDATICDGRCAISNGQLGSLCENNGCDPGLACTIDYDGRRRCLIPQGSNIQCESYLECVPNSTCINGKCLSGIPPYGICTNSRECEGNNNCLNGRCQPSDISIPGSNGSYCGVVANDCNSPLECQASLGYNLPPAVGYCVKPINIPYQTCSRFLGCLPISECDEQSKCNFQSNINACLNGKCSGGYTCDNIPTLQNPTGTCKSNSYINCSINSDCNSGGICSSYGINNMKFSNNGELYQWNSTFHGLPENSEFLSFIEVQNSDQTISTSYCGYTPENDYFYYLNNGVLSRINFEFTTPTGITITQRKNVKISNPNYITFHVQMHDSTTSSLYEKILFRDVGIISSPSIIIDISSTEKDPYPPAISGANITYYYYDFNGNYLYLIINTQNGFAYGPLFTTTPPQAISIFNTDATQNLLMLIPYTNIYVPGYDPYSILAMGYNVAPDPTIRPVNGYYLYNSNSLQFYPINIYLGGEKDDIPRMALSMGINNTILSFQFFYVNSISYYYGNYDGINSNIYPMAGYSSTLQSNPVQGYSFPNVMNIINRICT